MKEINVTVIGSGSTYCPELIYGFIEAKNSLKLKRVAFMDIDERKREIVGSLCVRMLKSAGIDCEVVMTDDLDLALQGADFVVTQIRVGKLPSYKYTDRMAQLVEERTGRKFNFIKLDCAPVMGCINWLMEGIDE